MDKIFSKSILLLIIVVFLGNEVNAQFRLDRVRKPYKFMIGVYYNAIDDDGRWDNLLTYSDGWNMPVFPSSVSFDYYHKNSWSFEGIFNYNRYLPTNLYNGIYGVEGDIISIDANAKYSFAKMIKPDMFDPFLYAGIGYTMRPPMVRRHMIHPNLGGGINIMVTKEIGIQLRSTAKVSTYPRFFRGGNYLNHHAGIVYRFGTPPGISNNFSKRRYNWLFKSPKLNRTTF